LTRRTGTATHEPGQDRRDAVDLRCRDDTCSLRIFPYSPRFRPSAQYDRDARGGLGKDDESAVNRIDDAISRLREATLAILQLLR
jgi:hypothetical protein